MDFGMTFNPLGFIGGIANAILSDRANKRNIAAQERINNQNIALQREFAQNSIQWRVNDAKLAGLHPLAALGASGTSYTPSSQHYAERAPQLDLGSVLAIESNEVQNDLARAQTSYWEAMAKSIGDSDKGLDGQNSNQVTDDSLVGSLIPEKKTNSNGDNVHAFGLSGDDIKQPLQDHAGESSFFANQRALAKGIVDGTIDYKEVDEYLTALGPGVVTTNGQTVIDAFLDTAIAQFKRIGAATKPTAKYMRWIRNSNRSPQEKQEALNKLLRNDLSIFGKIIE